MQINFTKLFKKSMATVLAVAGFMTIQGLPLSVVGTSPLMAQTLRMAYDADTESLDPHEQLSGATLQFSHLVLDPLVRYKKDMSFEPRLATSWKRIDATTMRFMLRKGVKFHSGNPFTADDVIFTFNRLKVSDDFKGIFTSFKEIKKIDDHTIDVITDGPFPLILQNATYIFPLDQKFYTGKDERGRDKAELVKHSDTYASTHVSGTGPFTVESREQGIKTVYKRFNGYWDKKSPGNVKEIVFTPISEGATRVAALLSGGVDFIAPVPPTDLERLQKEAAINVVTMSGTRIITLQLNQNRVEAFKNQKVRLAVDYAINNTGIVEKSMNGFATPAGQLSPKGYLGYNDKLKPRFDLKKAQALMKEAGFEKGFNVTMMCPNDRYTNDYKICEAAASMLSKINIKVELTTIPKAQYWPKFDERAADIMMLGWHSDTEDSANFYEYLTNTFNKETGRGQYNSGNYSNPKVDKMTDQANSETNDKKRSAIMQEIEKIQYDEAAFVPLHWQNLAWAAKKGVEISPILNVMEFPYLGDLVIKK